MIFNILKNLLFYLKFIFYLIDLLILVFLLKFLKLRNKLIKCEKLVRLCLVIYYLLLYFLHRGFGQNLYFYPIHYHKQHQGKINTINLDFLLSFVL